MDLSKEVQRYLGYHDEADLATREMIALKIEQMLNLSPGRFVYQVYNIQSITDDHITLENCGLTLESKSLARHLRHSFKLYLMAATMGQKTDRMIQVDTLRSPTEGLVSDAVGSTLIETICDKCEDQIISELSPDQQLTARFSPGYGDLSLEYHQSILKLLQTHKRIGLTCNDSHLLIPMKSVVAIVGVQENSAIQHVKAGCGQDSCHTCSLQNDCHFKKI